MTSYSIEQYRAITQPKPKRSKYNSRRTKTADGLTHMSAKQAKRWVQLCYMEQMGLIKDLKREVTYNFTVNGIKLIGPGGRALSYRLDHQFFDVAENKMIFEDVKSKATKEKETWPYKKALMLAVHGIVVNVV